MAERDTGLLAISEVTKRFGGITALDRVSFAVARNETVGLIGPNGSGKTTLFNILSGLLRSSSGEIRFCGREISKLPSHDIAAMGIGRTFQNARLFPSLTIFQNLVLPQFVRSRTGLMSVLLCAQHERRERKTIVDRANHLLGELAGGRLYARRHDYPDTCSLGEQRMVEIMRVLA